MSKQASYCRSAPWHWPSPSAPAQAAPATPATSPLGKSEAKRRPKCSGDYRRYHGVTGAAGEPAPWLGLGAGVVIGSIIANEAYRPRRGYYYDDYAYDGPYYYPSGYSGDPRAVCAENFRSFEWRTGLYTTTRARSGSAPT